MTGAWHKPALSHKPEVTHATQGISEFSAMTGISACTLRIFKAGSGIPKLKWYCTTWRLPLPTGSINLDINLIQPSWSTVMVPMVNPPDQTLHDLAHLAFCSLVALHTAVQQGAVTSPMAEHLFLVRWLATAQKQKRFPRSVASDIQQLLDKGRKQGAEAKLKTRFEYIWRTCTGELKHQNDLFRLTYAIETLKAQGWRNALVTQSEWNNGVSGEQEPALYVVKSALNAAFTTEGRLITPLEFKISGEAQIFVDALATSHITANCLGNTVTLLLQP